ncbi:unnamed protein product, partial [Rotaria socialis]
RYFTERTVVMKLPWIFYQLAIVIFALIITRSDSAALGSLDGIKIDKQQSQRNGIDPNGKASIHRPNNPNTLARAAAATPSNITYRFYGHSGGYALTGTTKVYVVYYGTWSSTQINIISVLISNLGNSSWFNIEKTYYSQLTDTSPKVSVSGSLVLGGSWTLSSSAFGTALTGNTIPSAFAYYVSVGALPNDKGGIYLWLSSPEISESSTVVGGSFLTDYCGYHYRFSVGNTFYVYGFIGNPKKYIGRGCDPYTINPSISPNGDLGVDAMASVISHEVVEAMSNPFSNAWGDSNGNENADKCAWDFGTYYAAPNKGKYNIYIGGKYYLIQRNWNAKTQACAQSA